MSSKLVRESSRSKEFWLSHIQRWSSSGLSKADYCRQNNLNAGNFYSKRPPKTLYQSKRI